MRRTAIFIGIATVTGLVCTVGVSAQETDANSRDDEFEITLDDVVDDVSDADGLIMTLIEEERDGAAVGSDEYENADGEGNHYDGSDLEDYDEHEADNYDDGYFDDYDDGEVNDESDDDGASVDELADQEGGTEEALD